VQDPFSDLAERCNSSGEILRQIVRHKLVGRGLAKHLPGPPALIADVGGGAGQQAIPLSRRGYEITIIDPSERTHETLGGEAVVRPRRFSFTIRRLPRLHSGPSVRYGALGK
jgi:2-polyprenyl-3-methyl-5-hydroxy-6-metoxy-1,4-benzoquinol methylase